jgi:cytoplasmic iron level regulating protein YaaA (DUF328/UPF0246 family)
VRILLPPSQGQADPGAGPPLDLGALCLPVLRPARERVLDALVDLCRQDPGTAARVLRLGPRQMADVERNAGLRHAPTAPAMQVYTGVLYAALDLPSLPETALAPILIASGLFGLVAPTDPIPAYRLPGSVRLPGLPAPRRLWAGPLAAALDADELVVDLRSGAYAALHVPPAAVGLHVMTLREGRKVPVSHFNKTTKGLLARELLLADPAPRSASELLDLVRGNGWDASPAAPGHLEVLVPAPVA